MEEQILTISNCARKKRPDCVCTCRSDCRGYTPKHKEWPIWCQTQTRPMWWLGLRLQALWHVVNNTSRNVAELDNAEDEGGLSRMRGGEAEWVLHVICPSAFAWVRSLRVGPSWRNGEETICAGMRGRRRGGDWEQLTVVLKWDCAYVSKVPDSLYRQTLAGWHAAPYITPLSVEQIKRHYLH